MTVDNLNPVSHCCTLEEAWSTVNSLRLAWGLVKLTSPDLSGGFVFMDGAVLAVYVDDSEQRGPAAWQTLAAARQASLIYQQLSRQQALEYFDDTQTTELDTGSFSATVDLPPFAQQQGLSAPAVFAAPPFQSSPQMAEFIESLQKEDSTLTDEQRAALDAQQLMADPEGFESENASLAQDGLLITDEQLSMLGKVLAARGIQQQQEEFAASHADMQTQPQGFFNEFSDPPAPDELDAIPEPAAALGQVGFASDFRTADQSSGPDLDEEVRNMPGNRPDAEVATVMRKPRVKPQYGKFLAPTLVIVLSVALYTVPAMVRHSAGAVVRPEVSGDQTHLIVNTEVHSYSPRQRQVFALPSGGSGPTGGNSIGNTSQSAAPTENADSSDPLRQAAKLQLNGAAEKASALLEEALQANPLSADVRIDLIKMYKTQKKLKRARELAVIGFRTGGCTPKQRDELWKLFLECREETAAPTAMPSAGTTATPTKDHP